MSDLAPYREVGAHGLKHYGSAAGEENRARGVSRRRVVLRGVAAVGEVEYFLQCHRVNRPSINVGRNQIESGGNISGR